MAKKDKAIAKKPDAVCKKGEAAPSESGKAKKGGKERFKGKGKWTGNYGDGDDLGTELAALGLRIKDITGDGNCFFRALGDQLQGDERQHVQLRQRVVSYIFDHQEDFSPFVEDDESFDSYIARMKKDGVWAGYMEVVAASRCLGANLTIYQAGQPRWRVINHPEDSAPMLHLSYHDGQHYNSVRCADDFATGPPAPVVIRGDGTIAARPPRPAGDGSWDERDERRVVTSTACTDMALVRKALEEARGDVEGAIERVIEALAAVAEEPAVEEPGAMGDSAASSAASEPPAASALSSTAPPAKEVSAVGTTPANRHVACLGEEVSEQGSGDGDPGTRGVATVRRGSGADDTSANPGDGAYGGGTEGDGSGIGIAAMSSSSPAGAAATAAEGLGAAANTTSATTASQAPPPQQQQQQQPAAAAAATAPAAKTSRVGGTRVAVGKGVTRRTSATAASSGPSNNKPCPCGSKKKYKACCGPAAAAAQRRRATAGIGPDGAGSASSAAAAGSDSQSGSTVVVAQVAALVI
ncbi:hypothetical protein PLESTF_000847500 [Pleodorina starrii]|nr:hypothetical protein PLESTM_001874900 [Pleodorina starrii]GLC69560.1 hypothetical protein PLESTF_000847500 [Pleodorina starrii]